MGLTCSCGFPGDDDGASPGSREPHRFAAVHLNVPVPCMKCSELIHGDGKQVLRLLLWQQRMKRKC